MMIPAMAGPTIVIMFRPELLKAMALPSRSRPTNAGISDERVGMPSENAIPCRNPNTMRCQTAIRSV